MTKNYYFTFIALFLSIFSLAQVGINTDDPQGILHIKNTTTDLGVVMPIVNSAEITKTPQGSVPVEATVVYDSIRQCLRLNTQSGWSDCLLDKSAVENIVNISVNGDRYWMPSAYSPLTDKLMQKKFSYGSYATIFASISDLDYVTGAGYSTYGLGISPAEIINPARRLIAHNALTVGGSYGSHIFITTTGEIYVSGLNTSGKLGTGDLVSQDGWTLVTIPGLDPEEKPVQLQTNLYSTIILTDKGNVYGAGANYFVGLGLNGSTSTFTKVPGLSNITSIWGERENDNYGAYTAIDADGKVFAWGYNSASGPWGAGASYIPTVEEITSFFSMATLGGAKIKKAVVGQASTFALLDDGTFWAATGQGQALWRIGLGSAASPTSNLINDLDGVVEADESFYGGKNKNRHKDKKVKNSQGRSCIDKTPVLGLLQREGKLTAIVTKDTSRETIQPIIKQYVKPDTTLISDDWKGYKGLGTEYIHYAVKHAGSGFKHNFGNEVHTNNIESSWKIMKNSLRDMYNSVSRKHLQTYVDEFVFRFNTRKIQSGERFNYLLLNSVVRTKYKDLTNA